MHSMHELHPASFASSIFAAPGARGSGISQLALVTVLHDSRREVEALLDSVRRHLPDAHVVAVDSGSTDGGPDRVRELAPGATVIEMEGNVGFGAANNAGVAAVNTPVTVLLNPDTEVLDGSLADLAAEVLRADRTERILAPLVLQADGEREDSAHPEPGSFADLARAAAPAAALPRAARVLIEPWRSDTPVRVAWATGCCLVARTETFRGLGPFDESIFMYAEDTDLGLRARDAGVETWFWPTARVVHHRAHASARVFGGEPFELLAERRRDVVLRRRGRLRALIDGLLQLATFANRYALKWILGRPAERERRQIAALLRAYRRT